MSFDHNLLGFLQKQIVKSSAIIACLLMLFNLAFGQLRSNGIPYIRNYSHKEYGASPFNWAITQDSNGLIYVGNNYVLLEWDGNTWRKIGLPNKTVIRSLAVDQKGKVYVGGQADFGYLVPSEKGEMIFSSLKSKIAKENQNFDDVWRIYVTNFGTVFCTAAGIYVLNNGQIEFYKLDNVIDLCFYVNERLFITDHTKGIYEFKQGKIGYVPGSEIIKGDFISGMLDGTGGNILVATRQHGIYQFDNQNNFSEWNVGANEFLKRSKIVTATTVGSGYAFGSSTNGVLILDRDGRTRLHLNKDKGLLDNGVESIYSDVSGNLWLAMRDGVAYIEINSPFTLYNNQVKISGSAFTSIIANNKLYLGTSDGLFCKTWSEMQDPLEESTFKMIENSQGQTYNLQKINDLILLSHHNGAFQIKDDKAIKISDEQGVWIFIPVVDHPNYLICGTYRGLSLYEVVNGSLRYRWKVTGFNESSRIMEQDDEGNLWIAHGYKGVYKLRLNSSLTAVEQVNLYNSKQGFPSDIFINVFKIDGKLIFTGERGIFKYDESRDSIVEHSDFNKLIDKTKHTRKLIQDKENNIWYSMADEIGVLKKSNSGNYSIQKTFFNKLEKKLVGGFEHIYYHDSRNVLIGTDDGFVHYDPSFNDNTDRSYNTLIRKVVCTSEKDSLLSGGFYGESPNALIQDDKQIPKLPFKDNSIRFSFSAISFEDATSVDYQYLLEGNDRTWSAWNKMTQKEYTNLKEGDYIFRVKAKDIYNRISHEAIYKFNIQPPWYRTYYAYSAYAILGILLLYGVRKFTKIEQQRAMRLREATQIETVLKAEKEIIKLNNEKLEHELSHKTKELTSSALHIVHNIETIQKLKSQVLSVMETVEDKTLMGHLRKLSKAIESEISIENNWDQFENHFNQIHQDFLIRLRKEFPTLTHADIKLCAYLRLNLSSKEIAPLLNLSLRGIEASRYRLRKKMNLPQETNLTEYIIRY